MNKKSFGLCLTASLFSVFNSCLVDASERASVTNDFNKNQISQVSQVDLLAQSTSAFILKDNLIPQTKARVTSSNSFSSNSPNISNPSNTVTGMASWYGPGFEGRLCANGEIFDPNALTAAHPSLPFNTRVRVTNLTNGLSVIVRINDRGPYVNNRLIDLSAQAAREIGMFNHGVAQVRLDIL